MTDLLQPHARARSTVECRQDFAAQLRGALTSKGIVATGQQKSWIARKAGVSEETARLWLIGESQPRLQSLQRLIDQGLSLTTGVPDRVKQSHWASQSTALAQLDAAISRAVDESRLDLVTIDRLITLIGTSTAAR